MKNLPFASIFIFTLCFHVIAQTNKPQTCPEVDVKGPAGVVKPDELAVFHAYLGKEAENYKIEYEWLVSNGEIVEGQGTSTIKVLQKKFGDLVNATVKIKGLPESCPSTDFEEFAIAVHYSARIIDKFSIPVTQISKIRLNNFAIELQKEPDSLAYIVEIFKENTPQKSIQRKIQKIIDYLEKERGVEKNRIVIKTAAFDKNLTQLWIVPAGTEFPQIEYNN